MAKKTAITKILSAATALALLLGCAGCGGGGNGGGGGGGAQTPIGPDKADEIKFPLEEPVSYTFMIDSIESTTFKDDLAKNELWKKLKADTNVDINFYFLGNSADVPTTMVTLANSGSYYDVLVGSPILNSITASLYYRSGMIVPITDYVNEEYMPNLMERVIKPDPEVLKSITAQDGEIICLPGENDANKGSKLESPIWINKTWLNKLGLKVPTTLDEFTNVLRKFATGDPNGNGKKDEIPMMVAKNGNFIAFEPWLGMFGIATKNGTNDAYVQVKNGKVEFQPTTKAYKDALKWFRQLYSENLIYAEAFTASLAAAEAKLNNDEPVVGVYTNSYRYGLSNYTDQYECILPPKVPGYDPCWYIHPGVHGTKNEVFVTDKCKNIGILMKWFDQLYTFENSIALIYNQPGQGRIEIKDNRYTEVVVDTVEGNRLNLETPTLNSLTHIYLYAFTEEDYKDRFTVVGAKLDRRKAYELYNGAGVLNDELWPRPYLLTEDAYTVSDISTDLFYTVDEFFSKTITGKWDIDARWNTYVKELKDLGLDEYMKALQNAYDAYIRN